MKHLFCLLITLWSLGIWADDTYDPQNPPEPNLKYKMTVSCSPVQGGTTSPATGTYQYYYDEIVRLSAYSKTGYQFDGWEIGGEMVSTNSSYSFYMPKGEVVAIAHYSKSVNEGEEFNPADPNEPWAEGFSYTITSSCRPSNGGSNSHASTMKEGSNTSITANPSSNFSFTHWEYEGEVVSTERTYHFTMPGEDVHLVSVYEFTPSDPDEPAMNYWNPATGVLIMDNFSKGSLSSAIDTRIGGSGSRNLVKSLQIIGEVSASDLGASNVLDNCKMFNIKQTSGYTELPLQMLNGSKIDTLVIPSFVESIAYIALYDCDSLSILISHALEPPVANGNGFYGVSEDLIVLVPEESLETYKTAEVWKNYIIHPIEIKKEDIQLGDFSYSAPIGEVYYDGQVHPIALTIPADFGECTVRYTNTETSISTTDEPTAVGSYSVSVEFAENEFYNEALFEDIATITILAVNTEDWAKLQAFHTSMNNGTGWTHPWNMSDVMYAPHLWGVKWEAGRVTRINLSENNIEGEFHVELLTLGELEELNLSGNKIDGSVDEIMTRYIQDLEGEDAVFTLTSLNLSNNAVRGNIGEFARHIGSLRTLIARGNRLSEVSPMISTDVSGLNLTEQDIESVVVLNLTNREKEDFYNSLPNICLYDHIGQTYIESFEWGIRLDKTTASNWKLRLNDEGVEFFSNSELDYVQKSGDTIYCVSPSEHRFGISIHFAEGDVNFSGGIDVVDLQRMINYMFGENRTGFNLKAADIIYDEMVNVQDMVGLIELILEGAIEETNAAGEAPMRVQQTPRSTQARLYIEGNKLMLSSQVSIGAIQVDLAECSANEIEWNIDHNNFQVSQKNKGENMRAMLYSMTGDEIRAGETQIATLDKIGSGILGVILGDNMANPVSVAFDKRTISTSLDTKAFEEMSVELGDNFVRLRNCHAIQEINIRIYDMLGRQIEVQEKEKINEGELLVGLSKQLEQGVYAIHITIGEKKYVFKRLMSVK